MRVLEFEGENPKYRILRDTAEPVIRMGKDGNEEIVCYSYLIEACRDFGDVKEDDIGGRVTGFHNLSHEGLCWIEAGGCVIENAAVRDNARVGMNAYVTDFALVCNDAVVGGVKDTGTTISGKVVVEHQATVSSSILSGGVVVSGNADVFDSIVKDHCVVKDFAKVSRSTLSGNAVVSGQALVEDSNMRFNSSVSQDAYLLGCTMTDDASLRGNVTLRDGVILSGKAELSGTCEIKGELHLDGTRFTNSEDFILFQDGRIKDGAPMLLDLTRGRWYLGERNLIGGWSDDGFIDQAAYHTDAEAREWYVKTFRPMYYKVLPSDERTLWEKIKMFFDK